MAEKTDEERALNYPLIWRNKRDGSFWGIVLDAYPGERARYIAEWKRGGYQIGPAHSSLEAAYEWL